MQTIIPSEITQISFNDATYKNCGVNIQPTLVNFFFGNNGSGKSTVAKAIKEDNSAVWKTGKSSVDYSVLVYNQDFIKANLQKYHNLPGVFTVNKTNIDIQNQVDEKLTEKENASIAHNAALEEKNKKESAKSQLSTIFQDDCWKKTTDLRDALTDALKGRKRKHLLAEAVLGVKSPKDHDFESLKRLHDAVYSADSKKYDEFNTIDDTSILDVLSGQELLEKPIISTSDSPFANFIAAINASAWVRQGRENYHETPDGKCPYCQQTLPNSFEEDITACFDAQYQEDIKALNHFYNTYKQTANNLFIPLETIPQELYYDIDITIYNDKLAVLKGIISSNLQELTSKIADPSLVVTIKETATALQNLSDIIEEFNKLIRDNNSAIASKTKKKAECESDVLELLTFTVKDEISHYKTSKATVEKEITDLAKEVATHHTTVLRLKKEISSLNSKIVNTKTTIDSVNTLLCDSGFQGFSLREKPDTPNVYEVARPDGTIAENLSEGERNFIAFLYFYHLVRGSETADEAPKNKIVVIDDPVSSMDSSTLFIVSTLVREMIEICENNAENADRSVKGNFIKQIFILTHNAFFHREITYNQVKHYLYVNFYLISKMDNKSSIKLCQKVNPDCPTEKMNLNPVQNSYAALWGEYDNVSSGIILMNVIRRIMEYYFLQLCGYDGATLRECILKKNKHKFITKDENGKEDYTQYHMVSAMLSYICASSIGINDSINYVDNQIDVDQCREIFKMIFTLMNQEQHYNLMMGIN